MKKLILIAAAGLLATALQMPAQGRGRGFHGGRGQGMAQGSQRGNQQCGQQCRGRADCCKRQPGPANQSQAPAPAQSNAPDKK